MICIDKKDKCCGCKACQQICPVDAIKMTTDKEGFWYPNVDMNKCVLCNRCEEVCPMLHSPTENQSKQTAYIIQNKQNDILSESTSGGAFTAIAEYIISLGGVVFGAVYANDFSVKHTYINKVDELVRMRRSKYVQSDIGNCYVEAKKFLDLGIWVCFSGTPCQIEGLSLYLGKYYEKLVLVDIVCHAVPSPLVWGKYINMQQKKYDHKITLFTMRNKEKYGYGLSTVSLYSGDNAIYHGTIATDPYLRAFFSNICDRPTCYNCQFKKRYRVSDLTMWDCFEPAQYCKSLDNNKGVTSILIQSEKGENIFKNIQNKFNSFKVDPDLLTENAYEMAHSVPVSNRREYFMEDLNNLSEIDLFNKYFPITILNQFENIARIILVKMGLFSNVKNLIKKIVKNYVRR